MFVPLRRVSPHARANRSFRRGESCASIPEASRRRHTESARSDAGAAVRREKRPGETQTPGASATGVSAAPAHAWLSASAFSAPVPSGDASTAASVSDAADPSVKGSGATVNPSGARSFSAHTRSVFF